MIPVLIVDDHKIIREGLQALIEGQGDFQVVGKAENGRQAVELAESLRPQVVIMDIGMPDLNGIEASRQLLQLLPKVKIIALSMHQEPKYISQMLQAGAKGYLLKNCAFEELLSAIDRVLNHQIYLSPGIAGIVLDGFLGNSAPLSDLANSALSSREREVLQLLAEGYSTKNCAYQLHVSIKTIESHRRQIMQKLDLHSIAELTKFALKEGITSL